MSATAVVSAWGVATGAVSCSSNSDARLRAGNGSRPAQSLIPVVGLVNRTQDVQVKSLRWQQRAVGARSRSSNRQGWRALKADTVNESQFEAEVLQSKVPVLVDFWASWCGPCRLMGIALDWAAQKYDGKVKCVKIETDLNQGLVDKYKVYGLPTLILFVNGEIVPNTQREGALTKEKLQQYLEKNLPALAGPTTTSTLTAS